ncbi:TSC22 domain family protein 2 isoform X2 [Ochotona curzoniae]|uniref:TSC22 domain family protein 2 isoform X2 n=1 Tax=Ochotona curzoniae TaxID=130825 RepID=UPI001B34940F|nr:TSC22 domain family protein 2 isoform X2 [Ochotona curzoniae]
MSKMPAKKKSCFQITSVTTAQVASSITEDSESLDDPDESRTEDVSSEIFDVSRTTDYGPEEACERSSSEETLNNVGEAETPGAVSPNLLLDGQLAAAAAAAAAPANGGGTVPARTVAGALASSLVTAAAPVSGTPAAAAAPISGPPISGAPPPPPAACSSRFRVIKLDHGSGEPYRRGRWTCMEYYERDADGSVLSRSGDCIRHSSPAEPAAERDSGLGATGGSVLVLVASVQGAHGPDSGPDSSLAAVSQPLPPPDKASQAAPGPPAFGVAPPPQQQQQQPPPAAAGPGAPPFAAVAAALPGQPQGAPPGPGAHVAQAQAALALPPQPGPAVAQQPQPPPAAPPQPFVYPQAPRAAGHVLAPSGPGEYLQQQQQQQHVGGGLQAPGPAQPPAAAFAVAPSHNAPSVGPPLLGAPGQPSDALALGPGPQAALGGVGPPQSVPAPPVGGSGQLAALPGGPHALVPGVPNVPAAAPAPSVPGVSTTSVTMPNVPAPLAPAQQLGSLAHAGLPLAPGTHSAPASLPQSDLSQFQTPAQPLAGPADDTRRKSEPLPQAPLALAAENKPVGKPPAADALANPLQLTPVNSLAASVFSIAIPVDGDEDSASGGGVVAIDNKIEQAMDLVKSHLMYAVREEVEVLKEQIKELVERNCLLERENALLKALSNNDQLSQLPAPAANAGSTSQQQAATAQPPQQPPQQPNVSSA